MVLSRLINGFLKFSRRQAIVHLPRFQETKVMDGKGVAENMGVVQDAVVLYFSFMEPEMYKTVSWI